MTERPFFSVVLPTYNRAHYLSFAVQSLLDQTFGDFELVISDNSSTDNTNEVVHRFDDPRIRYFKMDRTVPASENWNFALKQTRGEFITFCGDDDANSIVTLQLIEESLNKHPDCRLLGWQLCQYYLEQLTEPEGKILKDTVVYAPFSGKLFKKDAKEVIRKIFASHGLSGGAQANLLHNEIPSLVNAVFHRSIISRANDVSYFIHPKCFAIDRYNAVSSLNLVDDFFYLDCPLHLHGFSGKSGTATFESARNSFRNSPEEMLTQFECLTHRNYSANALLQAKADLGTDLDYVEIDWMRFFTETYLDLTILKRRGFPIEDDLKDFQKVLTRQPMDFQEAFRRQLPTKSRAVFQNLTYNAKNRLRPAYRALGLDKLGAKLRRGLGTDSYIYLNGQETGEFSDILQCARMINKDWLTQQASEPNFDGSRPSIVE